MSLAPPKAPLEGRKPESTLQLGSFESLHFGGDELAIRGVIDLAGTGPDSERLVVLDVHYRQRKDGRFGPYDIDGSGNPKMFDQPVLLVRQAKRNDGRIDTRAMGLDYDQPVGLGRNKQSGMVWAAGNLGYQENTHISSRHAELRVSQDEVRLVDRDSTNGSQLRGAEEILGQVDARFEYTAKVNEDIQRAGMGHLLRANGPGVGWGHGEYDKRPIIARDTPINGGVYPVGSQHGEALVIDDQKYPKELDEVYERFLSEVGVTDSETVAIGGINAEIGNPKHQTRQILSRLEALTRNTLRYDIDATDALAKDVKKVSLNSYIHRGVGVCRTQGALNAYILDRFVREGHLTGKVSIDRNTQDSVAGGHAWTRFTDPDGQVWIIDSAGEFAGTLQEAQRHAEWDYRRAEDVIRELLRPLA